MKHIYGIIVVEERDKLEKEGKVYYIIFHLICLPLIYSYLFIYSYSKYILNLDVSFFFFFLFYFMVVDGLNICKLVAVYLGKLYTLIPSNYCVYICYLT